jgi:hypothetical protein
MPPAGPHTGAADAAAGRGAEFGEEWCRHGELRLPDPASLTPVQGLPEPARTTLARVPEAVGRPAWADDGEARAALREAEACVRERNAPAAVFHHRHGSREWLLRSAGTVP